MEPSCLIQLQFCINSDPFKDINQIAGLSLFELSIFSLSCLLAPNSKSKSVPAGRARA